jgi:hypothetical protein
MAIYTVQPQNYLWKTQVAAGFFYPVFLTYDQTASKMPFGGIYLTLFICVPKIALKVLIQKAVQDIAIKATTTAIVHVTVRHLNNFYNT